MFMPEPIGTDLRTSLHDALPHASFRALALVDSMLLVGGHIGSASTVAGRLGFRNRFDLSRWLARQGLPPLHELAGWVSVLVWVDLCERRGGSLCALALWRGRDPAACYRLVQRLTDTSWSTVRALGREWVLERFIARCREARSWRSSPLALIPS